MKTHDLCIARRQTDRRFYRRRWLQAPRRLIVGMLIGLSGGTMLTTTCQSRFRDATVQASKDFVLSLFDPQTLVTSLLGAAPSNGG